MEKLLAIALKAALHAGKIILDIYNCPDSDFEIERKADNSPLTIADRSANQVILRYLDQTPYPVLSEEGAPVPYNVRNQWQTLWIVDPLDGTKEFIRRNGEFTVNIALIDHQHPLLGVIYIPVKKTLLYGSPAGAFKIENLEPQPDIPLEKLQNRSVPLPSEHHPGDFIVVASRSHMNTETLKYIEKLRQEHTSVKLISTGSSAKIGLVADGSADIYPRFAPTMEWDTAAGHAIVKAMGKNIYHTDGQTPLIYNKENLYNPWFIVK